MNNKTEHPAYINIVYKLNLKIADTGVGCFSCDPMKEVSFEESIKYLRDHPYDTYMHKYLLNMIAKFDNVKTMQLIKEAMQDDYTLFALLYEASLLHDEFTLTKQYFESEETKKLSAYTPLNLIKSRLLDDHDLHSKWIAVFKSNIFDHKPLTAPDDIKMPLLFGKEKLLERQNNYVHINKIYNKIAGNCSKKDKYITPLKTTAHHALNKLVEYNILTDTEMRHESSLSPFALLRKWHIGYSVRNSRHNYIFIGDQTSYGKGLSLDAARASYSMEIVERRSSFAGFNSEGTSDFIKEYPLTHASYEDLIKGGKNAVNPNNLVLETPYNNEALFWLEGEQQCSQQPILLPAQCVFLFCNLDEINLFSGLGSTGLASGNSIEEAKTNALLEIIERESEGLSLYTPSQCFKLEAEDPQIADLLEDYKTKGIAVQFQDISQPFGIPCYKCFVVSQNEEIVKGTGAHLDGKKALISALTETPYPYPNGPASNPGPNELPTLCFENLPDYSTSNPVKDLAILKTLLIANNYKPLYVNLTRKDLGIPVVKALIPGMEMITDFDRFSRVNPRLFANYLQLFQ
ncbi:MAG: YcaO-like family protein [Desulfobacteraceae bacterium]|nr:YcaO-like family protein [Desulfobacteraceae bacterium]MBC2720971.1 YcaO-like family protein [Desulfobacteraceae bacterium]